MAGFENRPVVIQRPPGQVMEVSAASGAGLRGCPGLAGPALLSTLPPCAVGTSFLLPEQLLLPLCARVACSCFSSLRQLAGLCLLDNRGV